MKKLLIFLVVLLVLSSTGISLVACNSESINTSTTDTEKSETTILSGFVRGTPPTSQAEEIPPETGTPISESMIVQPLAPGEYNKVVLGYSGSVCDIYFYVGIEKGIFKKYGLDVDASKASGLDTVATHKVDVMNSVLQSSLPSVINGMNITFGLGTHQGCLGSIMRTDANYTKWSDLKGKKIGIAGAFGGAYHLYAMRLILLEGGLDVNTDFEWLPYADNPSLMLALENGDVDLAVGHDRPTSLEVFSGRAKWFSFMSYDAQLADEVCCLLMFNGDFVKEHPKTAEAFTAAILEACYWAEENKEEAVRIEVDNHYIPGTYAENLALVRTYDYSVASEEIGYLTIYNSLKAYSEGGVNVFDTITDPKAAADNLFVYFDGIP